MISVITFPGPIEILAAGAGDRNEISKIDWGVYADPSWSGWPGEILDWPDFGLPADDDHAIKAVLEAIGRARAGQRVLVACRGGIGRTGTIVAALAVATGVPPERARDWVRSRYRRDAVETEEQAKWLERTVGADDRVRESATKTRDHYVKARVRELRDKARAALHSADALPKLVWAMPGELAITQRPLRAHPRYGGGGRDYPPEARKEIDTWIESLKEQGIRSIVVLTSAKELQHYDGPAGSDGGLLSLYRRAGLEVAHFPADDPAHDLTAEAAFRSAVDGLAVEVAQLLGRFPLPAVMHCSAAIDRSPPVAARVAFLSQTDAT